MTAADKEALVIDDLGTGGVLRCVSAVACARRAYDLRRVAGGA